MASITGARAKEIASKTREEGCLLLACDLNLDSVYKDENTQKIIIIDYLYDALMYAVKKGFSWERVATVFSIATKMIAFTENTLPEAITAYKRECEACQNYLTQLELKVITDYFFSTFFSHYKLYQYVFNNPQENQKIEVDLKVETPPENLPFSETKHISIWEYEKRLEDMDAAEEKREKERKAEYDKIQKQQNEDVKNAMDSVDAAVCTTDREKLVELIQSIASAHISAVGSKMNNRIEESFEELDYNLQKTSFPRPAELGQPPRMKTKNPPSAPSKGPKSGSNSGKSRVGSGKIGKGK